MKIYLLTIVISLFLVLYGCSSAPQKTYPKPVIVLPDEETNYTVNGYKNTSSKDTGVFVDNRVVFIGNRTSKKYHKPECNYAINMKEENRREFHLGESPADFGYTECGQCFKK